MADQLRSIYFRKQYGFPRAHFQQHRETLATEKGDVTIAFVSLRDPRSLVPKQACFAFATVSRPRALLEYAIPFLGGATVPRQPSNTPLLINDFPPKVRQAILDIEERLDATTISFAKSLRWRCNAHGTAHVFHSIDLAPYFWSLDQHKWFPVYGSSSFESIEWQFEYVDSILEPEDGPPELLPDEPLAFELLMEAQQLQYDNPRSALVIAVAAAESGTKRCIEFINPGLAGVLFSHESPPIVDLLDLYYPKDHFARIVPSIREQLTKAVSERNRLLHAGTFSLKRAQIRRRLRAIEDLLRLFDIVMGYTWAEKFLSSNTRVELGLPTLDLP